MSLNQFYKLILFIIFGTILANYQFVFPISISSESSMGYDSNFLKLSERDELYGEIYPELIGNAKSTSSIVGKHWKYFDNTKYVGHKEKRQLGSEKQTTDKLFNHIPGFSPIPAVAVHLQSQDSLPPFFDWKEIWNNI